MNRARSKRESIRHFADRLVDLLPDVPSDQSPPPDADGRRDADADDRLAVLRAKPQMSPSGMGTTSFEPTRRDDEG